jgi:NADPH:quinone reductase-like Zn-dependent oxidoreductase
MSKRILYKKVILTGYGGVDQLSLIDVEKPIPSEGELLIRVEFAGVAFADVMMRYGKYPGAPKLPFTPGYDVVGIVEQAPIDSAFSEGTRVVALTQFGGYAQYVVADQRGVVAVPDSVAPEKAVCLGLNYLTAYQMLYRTCHLKPNDTLLIHSAAGGVGSAVLQLGRHLELKLYGTASSPKHNLLKQYACVPIDYRNDDFVQVCSALEPKGFDVILDPIGPANWKRSKQLLKKGGQLVGYGNLGLHDKERNTMSGGLLALLVGALSVKMTMLRSRFSFYGVSVGNLVKTQTDLKALLSLAAAQKIDPVIAEILPLAQVQLAHEKLASGAVAGKIILDCR